MRTAFIFVFALVLAAKVAADESEERFAKKLRALYEARDIEGLLALVEFGDADTPPMIRDSKRKAFEAVAKSKIISVSVEAVSEDEAKEYAAPFEQDGVTYVPTLAVSA